MYAAWINRSRISPREGHATVAEARKYLNDAVAARGRLPKGTRLVVADRHGVVAVDLTV